MKKTYKFFTAAIIFSAIILSSCQGPVFSSIMKDVAEEDATMSGNIISVARYNVGGTEFLVAAAQGGLHYKLSDADDHGKWHKYSSLPFALHAYDYYGASNHTGERLLKVLADDTNLYLITVAETRNSTLGTSVPAAYHIYTKAIALSDSSNETWKTDDSETNPWTELTKDNKRSDETSDLLQFYKSSDYYYTRFNVFSTNSVKNDHRRVFIRSGAGKSSDTDVTSTYEYYEIDGTNVTQLTLDQISAATKRKELRENNSQEDDGGLLIDCSQTELSSTIIDSAAYLGDTLYFFNSIAVADNETSSENSTGIFYGMCSETASYNKKTNTDDLYYFGYTSDSAETLANKKILDAGEPISCFAVCNDALIIGRAEYAYLQVYSSTGGVVKIELNNRKPLASVFEDEKSTAEKVSFTTNADSQLSSSYEIFTLLNTDPSKDELDSSIYATIGYMGTGSSSSVSPKNVGMWSYYANRGNWNRE